MEVLVVGRIPLYLQNLQHELVVVIFNHARAKVLVRVRMLFVEALRFLKSLEFVECIERLHVSDIKLKLSAAVKFRRRITATKIVFITSISQQHQRPIRSGTRGLKIDKFCLRGVDALTQETKPPLT